MFSTRVPADLAPNALSRAVERRRDDGRAFIDLTGANPTRAGFLYPADLMDVLADARAITYAPEPLGIADARCAVSDEYARRGEDVPPERIVLTASTSEAYSLLFKLLCEPGDEVLIPRPSYPLFEHLTRLESVSARFYDLEPESAWSIDAKAVLAAFTDRTRAVLLVSPNNPTGSIVHVDTLDALATACAARGVALVADEVFVDYELAPLPSCQRGRVTARRDGLTFSLGGLSKSIGLPQVKLGWIAASGSGALVRSALARLEVMCDTYLSVSTPVQIAARALLDRGASVREQIQHRVQANYRRAIELTTGTSVRALPAEGGWYGVLSVPAIGAEEDLVVDLLEKSDVLAHPGYFFDFPRGSFLVVSLLGPEPDFASGIARILRHFDCNA
jgi:alanine-synthesizing transaminase